MTMDEATRYMVHLLDCQCTRCATRDVNLADLAGMLPIDEEAQTAVDEMIAASRAARGVTSTARIVKPADEECAHCGTVGPVDVACAGCTTYPRDPRGQLDAGVKLADVKRDRDRLFAEYSTLATAVEHHLPMLDGKYPARVEAAGRRLAALETLRNADASDRDTAQAETAAQAEAVAQLAAMGRLRDAIEAHLPKPEGWTARSTWGDQEYLDRIAHAGAVLDATASDRDAWRRKSERAFGAVLAMALDLGVPTTGDAFDVVSRCMLEVADVRRTADRLERALARARAKRLADDRDTVQRTARTAPLQPCPAWLKRDRAGGDYRPARKRRPKGAK